MDSMPRTGNGSAVSTWRSASVRRAVASASKLRSRAVSSMRCCAERSGFSEVRVTGACRARFAGRRARAAVRSRRREPAPRSRCRTDGRGGADPVSAGDGGRVGVAAADPAGRGLAAARRRCRDLARAGRARSRRGSCRDCGDGGARGCVGARRRRGRGLSSTACGWPRSRRARPGAAVFASEVTSPMLPLDTAGKVSVTGGFSPLATRRRT